MLALGTSTDKVRAQAHYYHGTAPLQHAGSELEGACDDGWDVHVHGVYRELA